MATFTIYRDKNGEFRWRLRAADNTIIADSAEGYRSRSDCREAVDRVMREASLADVEDKTLSAS